MKNQSILIILMIAVLTTAQNPGSRFHITSDFLNKAKDWAFPALFPQEGIFLNIDDFSKAGTKFYDMVLRLTISPENVGFFIRESQFIPYVNNLRGDLRVCAKTTFLFPIPLGCMSIYGTFSLNAKANFGVNEQGLLQIENLNLENCRIGDSSFHFGGIFSPVSDFFFGFINGMVQNKINGLIPQIKTQVNNLMGQVPSKVNFGPLPVSLDLTFFQNIDLIENQMIVYNNLFAYNSLKEKQRPPFNNDYLFPSNPSNKDLTLFLSEYSLNSVIYAIKDSGLMEKDISVGFLINRLKIKLGEIIQGLIQVLNYGYDAYVRVNVESIPKFEIINNTITIQADSLIASIISKQYDQSEDKVFQVKIGAKFIASAQIIDNTQLQINIQSGQVTNLEVVFSKFEAVKLDLLKQSINLILAFYIPELNSKLLSGTIPINSIYYNLNDPTLELVDHHIMIQANPVFQNKI